VPKFSLLVRKSHLRCHQAVVQLTYNLDELHPLSDKVLKLCQAVGAIENLISTLFARPIDYCESVLPCRHEAPFLFDSVLEINRFAAHPVHDDEFLTDQFLLLQFGL
jgi:hypothetical protein